MLRQLEEKDWLKVKKWLFEIAEQSFEKVIPQLLGKKIKDTYEKFPEGFVVSENKEQLNGLLWFEIFPEKKSAFVHAIYVVYEHRGEGISDELMAYLEKYCKQNNLERIELNVTTNLDRAIKFYQRHGFEIERYTMAKKLK